MKYKDRVGSDLVEGKERKKGGAVLGFYVKNPLIEL